MKKILDMGCGDRKMRGAIGIDKAKLPGVDVVHDLNEFPYPFEDETFDEVYCYHVLEHLDDLNKVMEEIHRISKNHARIFIKVPHYSHKNAWVDPTHVRPFALEIWGYYTRGHPSNYYSKARFKVIKNRLMYSLRTDIGLVAKLLIFFIQVLADASPYLCERVWCHWVGGFSHIDTELEVIKE
jgi:predicted SAM-dependent methyltransferase